MTDAAEIRQQMWKSLASSPFLMVELIGAHQHAEPMTAQLDPDADSAFWFYTRKDNRVAAGGPAMAQFVAKGHDLFACISGTLTAETDPTIIDKYWSKGVEAWYEGGRDDPNLLMLRFDLDDAEIWEADMGIKGIFKLLTSGKIEGNEAGSHAEVAL
jgi:general stress protein 26